MTISKKNKHHAKPPKSKPRLDTQVSAILDVPQTEKRERKLTLTCYALRRTPHRMPTHRDLPPPPTDQHTDEKKSTKPKSISNGGRLRLGRTGEHREKEAKEAHLGLDL